MSQIRKLKNRIEPWKKILADMDDLEAMYELASESGEASDEAEVRTMYEAAKAQFDKLNVLNLLSGEVDQNDAFLTVHAGAGGTEACDWAFMLSRMYLRWAERHGYKTEVVDELQLILVPVVAAGLCDGYAVGAVQPQFAAFLYYARERTPHNLCNLAVGSALLEQQGEPFYVLGRVAWPFPIFTHY